MKLSELNNLDAFDDIFDDPYEIFFDMKSSKKKKKKKKKSKDKESFEDSLDFMKKRELAEMADKMGLDLTFTDKQDKKIMKKAILKARRKQATSQESSPIKMVKKEEAPTMGLQVATDKKVPYYFDEKTRDFVITNADETDDMNCLNAMRSLGKIRKDKRRDDAFGMLIDRLDVIIAKGLLDGESNKYIEAEDYTVIDDE